MGHDARTSTPSTSPTAPTRAWRSPSSGPSTAGSSGTDDGPSPGARAPGAGAGVGLGLPPPAARRAQRRERRGVARRGAHRGVHPVAAGARDQPPADATTCRSTTSCRARCAPPRARRGASSRARRRTSTCTVGMPSRRVPRGPTRPRAPASRRIAGYVAVMPGAMERCTVDGEVVQRAGGRLLRRLDHRTGRRPVQGRPRLLGLVTASRRKPSRSHPNGSGAKVKVPGIGRESCGLSRR